MSDVFHVWRTDLMVSATGDIAMVSGSTDTQQRILRRLLTNAGDYIWQLDYGAGLAQFVGAPTNEARIMATVRSQIFKEAAVARMPEPVIDVHSTPVGAAGTVYVQVQYVDATTNQTELLSFSVNN